VNALDGFYLINNSTRRWNIDPVCDMWEDLCTGKKPYWIILCSLLPGMDGYIQFIMIGLQGLFN